jgi:hypothetical protein
MTYTDFKKKVKKAYPNAKISFVSNGAQHTANVEDDLILYMNTQSDSIYGMMNGVPIGRALGMD